MYYAVQVLRFVGRVVRENTTSANVVGVILDEPRDASKFKSARGYFGEVRVLDCPAGYGFVSTVGVMEKAVVRVTVNGVESWVCHSCHHANPTPKVGSVLEYLELSLGQLDSLVRCASCSTVRVWHCPRACCGGQAPLEVAEVAMAPESPRDRSARLRKQQQSSFHVSRGPIASMVETFTCPRCFAPPTDFWPCPQCDNINTGANRHSKKTTTRKPENPRARTVRNSDAIV